MRHRLVILSIAGLAALAVWLAVPTAVCSCPPTPCGFSSQCSRRIQLREMSAVSDPEKNAAITMPATMRMTTVTISYVSSSSWSARGSRTILTLVILCSSILSTVNSSPSRSIFSPSDGMRPKASMRYPPSVSTSSS